METYCDKEAVIFSPFTGDKLERATIRMKCGKAPGLGCIPGEFLKLVIQVVPDDVLGVYNDLATQDNFHDEWRANLVLFRKGDIPDDSPSSYRPYVP